MVGTGFERYQKKQWTLCLFKDSFCIAQGTDSILFNVRDPTVHLHPLYSTDNPWRHIPYQGATRPGSQSPQHIQVYIIYFW